MMSSPIDDNKSDNDSNSVPQQVVLEEEKKEIEEEGEEEETYTASDTITALEAYKRKRVYGTCSSTFAPSSSTPTTTSTSKLIDGSEQVITPNNDGDGGGNHVGDDDDDDDDDGSIATVACAMSNEDLFEMGDDNEEQSYTSDNEHGDNRNHINTDNDNHSDSDSEMVVPDYTQQTQDEDEHDNENEDNNDNHNVGDNHANNNDDDNNDDDNNDKNTNTMEDKDGYYMEEETTPMRQGRKKKRNPKKSNAPKRNALTTTTAKDIDDNDVNGDTNDENIDNSNAKNSTVMSSQTVEDDEGAIEDDSFSQTQDEIEDDLEEEMKENGISAPTIVSKDAGGDEAIETTMTSTDANTDTDIDTNIPNKPSDRDLRKKIHEIFLQFPDKDKITVGQFRELIEGALQTKLDKKQKKMMKQNLIALISAEDDANTTSDDEEEEGAGGLDEEIDEEFSSTESDYEESNSQSTPSKKKKRSRSSKKKHRKGKVNNNKKKNDDDDNENENSGSETEEIDEYRSPTTRPRKPKKPSHVKIHHEMRRKKILAEAKIRAEELQATREQKLNEEDQKRAQLIAKKFDTNTDEARIQRMEDRIGLLGRLKQKRLDLLADDDDVDDDEDQSEDMKLSMLSSINREGKHCLTSDVVQNDLDKQLPDDEDEDSIDEGENSTEETDDDDDDDDELQIVGGSNAVTKINSDININKNKNKKRKKSQTSIIDIFGLSSKASVKKEKPKLVAASFSNPRAALRNALRAKQFESGNRWLAKELGYDKSEDHIRECKMIEVKKRKQIVIREEERLRLVHERNQRLKAIVKGEVSSDQEAIGEAEDEDQNEQERSQLKLHEESDIENKEEEDEEIAMAREIESERLELRKAEEDRIDPIETSLSKDDAEDESLVHDSTQALTLQSKASNEDEGLIVDSTQETNESEQSNQETIVVSGDLDEQDEESPINATEANEANMDKDVKKIEGLGSGKQESKVEPESDNQETTKNKRPKNANWKAMIEQEKQLLKKQKAIRKGQAIDDEAEEDEEEEGVTGLEDFGFTLNSKKKENDDDDEANEEDFENIVDEVSDGEGDEEAGDVARTALHAKEEKMRHKEVLRRIREGYDGRRGGVAGGGSKRGNLRFDQLVSADNKNDAKRLGLLNDDELDSEDEEGNNNGTGEVEDEEILIDRMLKERYLNQPKIPEENFSDSEDGDENEQEGGGLKNDDAEEDQQQERLAKRFAKRARMNRLLEIHGDEEEFTQSRLLEEDQGLRKELTKIRTVHGKRMRQVSLSSTSTLIGESNHSMISTDNHQNSNQDSTCLLPLGSTLSIALGRNRKSKKRKTSFLGGKEFGSNRSKSSTMKRQAVSLGHVVFGEESQSMSSMSNTPATMSKSSSLTRVSSKELVIPKRSVSSKGRNGSSLWAKVSASTLRKRRRG